MIPATIRDRIFPRKLARSIDPWVRNQDILHLHGVWDTCLQIVAKVARDLGKPYVVMPHGMVDPWSISQKQWKKKLALRLGTRTLLRDSAGTHLHADEAESLRQLHITTRGFAIPNGVSLEEIDPVPTGQEFRDSLPELGDHPYVLFLGRIHYKKGLDYLAHAFAQLNHPEVHLVVAGPDDGERENFEKLIQHYQLGQRVHLPGPIYGRRKWSALSGAGLFVLPSRQEGFSVAILEALATRTPVVISDQCHFPEVAAFTAGRVVSLDAGILATAMREILTDSSLRSAMSQNGRTLIERCYTWDRVARSTLDMYERILRSGKE